jgi:exosortase
VAELAAPGVSPDVARGSTEAQAVWVRIGIAGVAVVALYAPILIGLAEDWAAFPNLSHGFAIPLIAGYLVWVRRGEIAATPIAPSGAGLPLLLGSLVVYTLGAVGGEPFLARISLPFTVVATILFFGGARLVRRLLVAVAYLLFMIPLPYITLKGLTDQMRVFDATTSALALPWLGVPVFQEGYLLHLPRITLEVADVCSSIPAIAALLAVGAAYGLVNRRPAIVSLVLLLGAVPLGIFSNIIRIILTAAGTYYIGPIALQSTVHAWNGATVFLMTLGLLILLDSLLMRLWARRR